MKLNGHIKLGVFIALSLVLFFLAIFFIGKARTLFTETFRISAVFTNVDGLQVGNQVRFGGIHVGTIESIEMVTDSTVMVELIVETKVKKFITNNSTASIGSDGLMGNKMLIISPGTAGGTEIENEGILETYTQPGLDDILVRLAITTENAALITEDLSIISHNIKTGRGTIGKLFMDSLFAENLDKTLVNVKNGTQGFKENMDAAKHSLLLKGFFKRNKK